MLIQMLIQRTFADISQLLYEDCKPKLLIFKSTEKNKQ